MEHSTFKSTQPSSVHEQIKNPEHWPIFHLSGPWLRQHVVCAHLRVDCGPVPVPRLRQGLQGGERVRLGAHAGTAEDTAQPEGAGKARWN